MSYLRCDGTITNSAGNVPACDTGWIVIPDSSVESIFQPISMSGALDITAAILACWAIAYGIRFLLGFVNSTNPGRFG